MFDWTDYLAFARNVLNAPPGPPEGTWRAAASRAYYAAFQKCRETIERRDKEALPREKIHAEVLRRLQDRQETHDTSRALKRLYGKRVHADYNADRDFTRFDAEVAAELAAQVLRFLGQQRGGSEA